MGKTTKFILIFLISGVVFFLLTTPFHRILSVFTFSEVRPSAVLYPILGISFGLPAALGITAANFINDAVNGYPIAILLEGILPQFLYVMIPYLLWKRLMRGEDHIYRLDCVSRVLKFILVCLVYSVLSGICVGFIIQINFGSDFRTTMFFVFLNNFDISVMLGCPLMILFNQVISRRKGMERVLTVNEKIILISAVIQLIGLSILIITLYSGSVTVSTYDIWNTIYLFSIGLINGIMLLTLLAMMIAGNAGKADRRK